MRSIPVICFLLLLGSLACKKDNPVQNADEIPNVPVNLTVNMDLPQHFDLQQPGQWKQYDGGVKGIVVYHSYDGQFYAFDRNCSYKPFDACAVLEVEDNNLYFHCGKTVNDTFTKCCDSRFELSSGFPVEGPATKPLKIYSVYREGNTLYIGN
jgi:nitrite reductase/ring-hydroxylating ferredoxin subunit